MTLVHMMRERKGKIATTRCKATVRPAEVTIWETEVTCPECVYKPPSEPTARSKRLFKRPLEQV